MFTYVPKSTEDLPIFSTGMIGQYAHGNEPSHHVIYLYNKVCIITGAAQGIGKSMAERFASDGAIVYACDRAEGVMDEWAKACSEDNNTRVLPLYFDVTDATAVKSAFMSVFKQEGRIDALINNAGVVFNKKIGMILRPETELMFRVNVIAVIEMIQLVSRLMARNHSGSIVNIASVTAVLGSPGQSAYSATKGAIMAFTKSAAKELAPLGIRVNAVAPGIVKTERFSEPVSYTHLTLPTNSLV